ncbi:ABC transporter permease [Nannocystis bainbridge]|uniref:ABC transporter permease n=1 Tax=Nannocystis bainbridge TaxID=2995303 RepID=A0ABT5EDK6_9BACT|nr:ABC transporter permease [Nannocystis bainbridge]MDC0723399.1 ABC transporter permease [Nannocystis bainbridge]
MLSWATPLALAGPLGFADALPEWAPAVGYAGAAALGLLVLFWLLSGALGYERSLGLRIIRAERVPRGARLLCAVCWAIAGVALLLLNLGYHSLALVIATAAASFLGLLLLLVQYSSIFGTTSIIGVVLGVAALIVVQSVATGFQHEFERRVLGVYAHINVTRSSGMAEYRRFEAYLRTRPGVTGASPFVYYAMMLAPYDPEGGRTDDLRLASVLVKGIEPETAAEVIDLPAHLQRGSGRAIPLPVLRSDFELMPVPDREPEELPPAIAVTPDPRGAGWYERAMNHYAQVPAVRKRIPGEIRGDLLDDDAWPEESATGEPAARFDASALPTIFVGASLARDLGLHEDSLVMVVDPGSSFDASSEPEFQYYRVAGIFQAGFQEYDSRLVYVHIKELQRFKYRGRDQVSGIDLRLQNPDLSAQVGATIRAALPGREYQVLEWQNLNENLFKSIRLQKNIITVILSLVITVATFNVLSALWTMVVRRTNDVAILMSMGATGPQVARIFQVTGMAIGLSGAAAGVLFGLVLCWLVSLYGYTLDPEVYFIEELPVEFSLAQIGWILAMTLAICFVATLPPSLRAAKLRPVEGLRYE